MKIFTTALVAAAALYAIQSPGVAATSDTGPLVRTVRYADIDVSRPAGATELYRRIHRAAAYVCSPLDGRDAERAAQFRACVKTSVGNAIADVNAPGLTDRLVAMKN